MSTNGLRKFNHHPSGMKESFLGDYYYDTEVDAFIRTQQATIERLTEQLDGLVQVAKIYRECNEYGTPSCQKGVVTNCKCIGCNKDLHESLVAEIEAEK